MIKGRNKLPWKRQLILFTLLVLVLLGGSILYRGLRLVKNSIFDGQHRITVVLDTGEINLLTLEPKNNRGAIVSLPANVIVPTLLGQGEYQIGKVFQLGQIDKNGGRLLLATSAFFMGAPVDGWMVTKVKSQKSKCKNAEELFSIRCLFYLLGSGLKGEFDTNLTPFDMGRIFWALSRVGTDMRSIKLPDDVSSSEELFSDGEKVIRIKESAVDKISREVFLDSEFRSERLNLAIVNGTNVSGIGARFARVLTNAGVNIISVTTVEAQNLPIKESSMEILAEKRQSYTVKKLERLFKLSTTTGGDLTTEDGRVTLGTDLFFIRR